MRLGRLILVTATLVTILVFPLLMRDALQALRLPSAYAAPIALDPGGRVYQNGNNDNDNNNNNNNNGDDDDDNNNNNNNNREDDNDNVECFLNLNSNEEVPCDFNQNDNNVESVPTGNNNAGGAAPAPAPAAPSGSVPPGRRCFDVQEVGDVRLNLEGGSITIQVVPPAGFSTRTWVELGYVDDLSALPAPPAGTTMLDRMAWRVSAGSPCDGPAIGQLPGAVNLGIPYNVPANKSKLQIVILRNGAWQEIPTVPDPDPNNPYISATIQETGIYAVIQKP